MDSHCLDGHRHNVGVCAEAGRISSTYPELVGAGARARLVVLALEVGGRWSLEGSNFVKFLAKAKARSELKVVQRPMEQPWKLWWSAILACAASRSFAASLLGLRGGLPRGRRAGASLA